MMTMAAFCVGARCSKVWPSRIRWQTSTCSLWMRGVVPASGGAARSVESMGQPAVTEPATTNLMKSRRDWDMGLLRVFEKFLDLRADSSGAQAIPDDNQRDGHGENHREDGVDFGRDAAAQASPDLEGQGIVTADEEEGDGDFVHGEREDEQAGSDEGELQVGKRDAPESLPGRCAEVERGFFLRAIEFLQAGEELGGGDGNERGAVAEENGDQAELHSGEDCKHEQREAGDDAGENQWEQDQAAEEGFAGEAGAVERERSEQAEGEGERDAGGGDEEAVDDGVPDGSVAEKPAVPVERELARRESADAVAIEGIKDEHDDRQINEAEDQDSVSSEQGRSLMWVGGCHLKDQRFSRRSVEKSNDTVMSRMQTEIAAPSGQS